MEKTAIESYPRGASVIKGFVRVLRQSFFDMFLLRLLHKDKLSKTKDKLTK